MIKKPFDLTIAEAALAMSQGRLSPVQLVKSCLERIETLEGRIQAWALVDSQGALEAALRLEDELHSGHRRSPLHGIPVGIKDIFYTNGLRTEAGSRSWSGFIPSYDAGAVTRLREAGAIILGKTRTTEFAYMDPAPTHNPWNIAHTPGGSSSGSAAAVAAHMCPAALGTQTGGSTLRPAAYTGIVGFKPQHGRISTYGIVPASWTMDHVGILARTVEDTALVFREIAGHDPKDHSSLNIPDPDCLDSLDCQQKPRLGLVRQHFFDNADQEMQHHVDDIVKNLCKAGATVEEFTLPASFATIDDTFQIISEVEMAAYHQKIFDQHSDQYGPIIRGLIEKGLSISATDYARALQMRLQQRADIEPLVCQVDALLTPGATGTAPYGLDNTGSSVMQRPWSFIGLPAISLPTGLNQNNLPLAIQLIGARLTDCHLLAIARWCEQALGVDLQPSLN